MKSRFILLPLIIVLAFGFWLGRDTSVLQNVSIGGVANTSGNVINIGSGSSADEALLQDVWSKIHTQYFYKNVNTQSLYYGAIQGMVSSLGDPVSLFYTPDQTKQYDQLISGSSFSGIGVELGYKDNQVIIEKILPDSPASKSNLAVGDVIESVGNQVVSTQTIDQIVNEIRGKNNTSVTIGVLNPSNNAKGTATITRAPVNVASMDVKNLGNGIVDIEVTRFTDDTLQDWEGNWDNAVSQALSYNPKGLIIDLRGNPGGYFEAAVYAAGDFLPNGSIVAYQQDRDNNLTPFPTQRDGRLGNMKTVILVNGGTASAAEILSGALQYYKKATIVGEKTYGKGTAQDIFTFSDGSTLHLTTKHWLLPSKRWINHDSAIQPDISIAYPTSDFMQGNDPQLQKAESLF